MPKFERVPSPLKWRGIDGFPGYEVSDAGGVRRGGRSLTPDTDDRGRRRFTLRRDSRSHKFMASRLVLAAFVGPCPDGMEACHDNGDCADDRLVNLRWDTHSANLLDRRRHGTNVQGEMINTAKLTADQVREIRRVGHPIRRHAEKYGVSETLVSLILRRKVWQHV